MLFNSLEFILLFVPLCVIGFYLIAKQSSEGGLAYLLLCSLIFYGAWNPPYLLLLGGSIAVNFILGRTLQRKPSKPLVALAVLANLFSIVYFKYMDFFITTANGALGTDFTLQHIVLPLGISFFTFQQISYVIECYRGQIKDEDFLSYALFVSFFPQLIAGPIVRFQEIVPQFLSEKFGALDWSKIAIGLIVFSIGLSKKIFLADHVAEFATPVFNKADAGTALVFAESWFAAIAYSFQIYFDFSAYSDMAIGLALMLGLTIPVNFRSPYKAQDIIEFWRTWHITLSRFLRDYLYYPLGGNRCSKTRRYLNLIIVMLLGGLWHGASWNFVIWGGLHGLYLMLNHGVRALSKKRGKPYTSSAAFNITITFLCVTLAWVFFRAESLYGALNMVHSMLTPNLADIASLTAVAPKLLYILLPCICVTWLMPNATAIQKNLEARLDSASTKSIMVPSIFAALGLSFCIYFIFAGIYSEFIYFQF